MAQKKPKKLSPQAAKVLEQYRSATNKGTSNTPSAADGSGGPGERTSAPMTPGAQMRRSGSRGK